MPSAAGASPNSGFGPVFLDRSINFFVNEAFQFAIPAAVFIVTGEPALAAVVFGLEWTARLSFLFFGGTVIDRLGPVASARAAWFVRSMTGSLGFLGVLISQGSDNVTAAILAGCGIISAGFFQIGFVANERLAADVVDRGSRAEVVQSRLGAVDQAALIGGPVLGGAFLLLGVPALLAGYSLAMAVGLVTTRASASEHRPPVRSANSGSSAVRDSLQAVRTVVAHRLLRITMLTAMAANIVLAAILSTLASVVGLLYGHDPRAASLITSAGGAISLVTILLTPLATRRFGYARCLWTMTGATVAAGALATLTPAIILFAAVLTVAYVGDSVIAMVARSVRIRVIPRDRYSSLMSATVFLNFLPMPFAGLLIGALVGRIGLRATWITVSMIALALGIAAWLTAHARPAEQPGSEDELDIFYEKSSR
ncbi:MAG: MFS transporter [Jatrophihabitantaceae bacterium]